MRTSCNGCRILRKGCSDDCLIRPCLEWIISSDSQANATLFLAKFYGRAGLLNLLAAGPSHLRPAMFRSLLYDACGRIMDPINGATGLMISGQWYQCQVAVDCVMRGVPIIRNPHHLTITSDDSQPPSIPTLSSSLPWVDIRHVSNSRKLLMTSSPQRSSSNHYHHHPHPGSSSTSIRPLCGGTDAAAAGPSTQAEELMMMSTDHHHHHHHTSGGSGGDGVVSGCGCGGCGETNQMEYSWCCHNTNNNDDQDDLDLESGGVNHHDQRKLEHMNKPETEQMEESSSIGDKGSGEDIVGLDLTLGFKL